jgi:NADH-quinone oxidoreductase subunit J
MRASLIRAAIALAVTSIVLTILMFQLNSPLAAVFELSVCAGLITVIFMSTISLTKPLTYAETLKQATGRARRFWPLPAILVVAGGLLATATIALNFVLPIVPPVQEDVRNVLWNSRQLDLYGQVLVLLVGVFAVVVLFKNMQKKDKEI